MYAGGTSGGEKFYGPRIEGHVHQDMEDFIRDVGFSYHLHSDNAKTKSGRVRNSLMRK